MDRHEPVARLDHLVYLVPDLERALDHFAGTLGVRPTLAGRHPAWDTHNAVLGLGDGAYFELLALDPASSSAPEPPPFGLVQGGAPRLATWCARTTHLEDASERLRAAGCEPGSPRAGSRRRADGVALHWRSSGTAAERAGGVIPFLIDWGTTPHPASSAPPGVTLLAFQVRHPDPEPVRRALRALDLDVVVERHPAPGLAATLGGPRGTLELS